ncbi:MAG: NEW3 domain-containing protein, partial [Armatimonadota bacterium]|nr:NEW3 domain-containing protein [Armatimonadota bacterium]
PISIPPGANLALNASPIYVLLPHGKLKPTKMGRMERTQIGPRPPARTLILRIRPPDNTFHKDQEYYQFRAGEKTPLGVEVYNFSAIPRRGTIVFHLPAGWKMEPASLSMRLGPMDRQAATVTLTPPTDATPDNGAIGATFRELSAVSPADEDSTPVSLDVTLDPATLQPSRRAAMNFNNPLNWQDNISGNGSMTHGRAADDSLQFDINFQKEGDRWAYPTVSFNPPADWRPYSALAFDYTMEADEPGTRLSVILGEPNGSAYISEIGSTNKEWKHVIAPFAAFTSGTFAPTDPDGKLDLDQIALLRIGCNTKGQHVTIRLKNVELVGYGK